MDTPSHDLDRLFTAPESLSVESLRDMVRRYPFFPLPAMELLRRFGADLDETEKKNLQRHAAIVSGDRKALFDQMSERSESFASIYPPAPVAEQKSTDRVLDTFFATYGMADPEETALLERQIFNPVADYSETLLREDSGNTVPQWRPGDSLDDFLNATPDSDLSDQSDSSDKSPVSPPIPRHQTPTDNTPSDDTLLSESLAKIFIKQGRYERAYEIISNLSLNYPKKSIYFADQLRFLQKLIKIQQAQTSDNS